MSRGIYITANDRFTEQAIALLNSIRFYDPQTPIILIPYDDNYHNIAKLLADRYNVQLYPDLQRVETLAQKIFDIFGDGLFARPNQFRKQVCWFGEFDEFLYIDTDIVVFEKIADNLNYLDTYDFLCCDYQYLKGIKNVFTPQIIVDKVITDNELQDIYNGGFWASKRNLLSESELYDIFQECAAHLEYFDFSEKTSDQPIINYMILKRVPRRYNLLRGEVKGAGNWAGSSHFQRQGDILYDPKVNQSLKYLHWAGIRIEPGCPYWDIWKHYRYLGDPNPPEDSSLISVKNTKPLWQRIIDKVTK
jgi:hypothetical protein